MNNKNNVVTLPKNGPEFAPIRTFVKEFKIKVTVYDNKDNIIREEIMDYGKPDDRVWLGKLSYWSWINGHYVETEKFEGILDKYIP